MVALDEEKIEGFRIGEYFVTFPDVDEIIKEDDDGRYYINVDIYKLDSNNNANKMSNDEVTPELEQMISLEIHRLLTEGLSVMSNKDKENNDEQDQSS